MTNLKPILLAVAVILAAGCSKPQSNPGAKPIGRSTQALTPGCGNGVLEPERGETCDDGNVTPLDGCGATCLIESGFVCVGERPSTCTAPDQSDAPASLGSAQHSRSLPPVSPFVGRDFWTDFPYNAGPPASLALKIAGDPGTTGSVTDTTGTLISNFTIPAGGVATVQVVPIATYHVTTSNAVNNLGIHVTASAQVRVLATNEHPNSTDTWALWATEKLGIEYIVLDGAQASFGWEINLIAPQAATTVTIKNVAGTVMATISLGAGQAYQYSSATAIVGYTVSSNNPIAVLAGTNCTNDPGGACDITVEQMAPVRNWARDYVVAPTFNTANNSANHVVVASQDNTTVMVTKGDGTQTTYTLNARQSQYIAYKDTSTVGYFISADKPIGVASNVGAPSSSWDPSLVTWPPIDGYVSDAKMPTSGSTLTFTSFLSLITRTSATGDILVNGATVSGWTQVATTGYSFAQVAVPAGDNTIHGNNGVKFGAVAVGGMSSVGYAYSSPYDIATVGGTTNCYLGTLPPDYEGTLTGSAACDADDLDSTDDEDAFTYPTSARLAAASVTLSVPCNDNYFGVDATATVHGWIDFNRNGTFEAGEHSSAACTDNSPLTNGSASITWTNPTYNGLGDVVARFRICDVASDCSAPTGAVASGEVEDHLVHIGQCGDGVLDTFDACDDNNTASSDGCSSTCTVESGFSCTGSPSVCLLNQAPAITAPADNTLIININTTTLSGTCVTGATVRAKDGATIVCTSPCVAGAWSCLTSPMSDGSHSLTADQTINGQASVASAARTLRIDTIAPLAPVITSPVTGTITNVKTPVFSGTCEPGAAVAMAGICSATCTFAGTFNCTASTQTDGLKTVTALQTDVGSNLSAASNAVAITIDSAAPSTPTITSPAAGVDPLTATPTFTGACETGAVVKIVENLTTVVCTTTCAASAYSCVSSPLGIGSHTVQARQTDAAGNPSPFSAQLTFPISVLPAMPPSISAPAAGATVDSPTPTITLTGCSGTNTVTVYEGATALCTGTCASTTYTCAPALADGVHVIAATQTVGGTESARSSTVSFTVAGTTLTTTGTTLAYNQGDPATAVDPGLTAVGTLTYTSATVAFTAGYVGAEDALAMPTTGAISASFSAGTLTLTGSGTPADYQAAFRAVTYVNSVSPRPTTALRTVRFTLGSNTASRSIQVKALPLVVVGSSAPSSASGQTVTLTATLTPLASTGNVQFLSDGVNLGAPVALVTGVGTLATADLPVGTHVITASYAGDTERLAAVSADLSQTITALANGVGPCTVGTEATVCVSGLCNASTLTCGGPVNVPCTAANQCASNACGSNGQCGLVDGQPGCTVATAPAVCQSGTCSANAGTCVPAVNGCAVIADCGVGQQCNLGTFTCELAPAVATSDGGTVYDALGADVVVDPQLTVVGASTIGGATVTLATGFVAAQDSLVYSTVNGITGAYSASTGVLTLTGDASTAEYQAALRTVKYHNSAGAFPVTAPRSVTFGIGLAVAYSANGHFYEYISGGSWTWPQAETAAAARTYSGLQGYLATIGDSAENAYVSAKLNGAGWMGASAPAGSVYPRVWSWVTGPETGDSICNNTAAGICTPIGGAYTDWNTGEPNNSGSIEYRAQFLANGLWNDLPNTSALPGYVVEYGGSTNDPVLTLQASKALQVRQAAVITISPTPTNGTVVCTSPVVAGTDSTCTITPSVSYRLATLTDNGADVLSQVSSGQYVITAATGTHTIAATFVYVPPVLTVTPGTAQYDALGAPVTLDPSLSLVGAGTLGGATVTIGAGFAVGDVLNFTDQLGITGSYDAAKGLLTLTGTAPVADYQTALASVTYSNSAGATPPTALRTVTFAVGTAVSYQANSHFYEYISGGNWTWLQAEAAASNRTYYGLQGYLATIGDSAENAYVSAKLNGAGWMGAASTSTAGGADFPRVWSWVTGPEAGTDFCNNTASGVCTAINGGYMHWNTGEPNNMGNEYRAQFLGNGLWNDLPNTVPLPGYVVEYGGTTTDPVLSITGSRSLQVRAATSLTITSTLNPAEWAQDVTFLAHLVPAAATGNVQFLIDGANFGPTVPIIGGVATSGTIVILTIGTHSVTATYAGDTERQAASGALPGGQSVTKASNGGGTCDGTNAATVCVSAVCDPDGKCGYANNDGPCDSSNASTVCRTGVCDPDGRCGYADGNGTCVAGTTTPVCRSGECGQVSGICRNGALNGCGNDSDCFSTQYCDGNTFTCATKVAAGAPLPNDPRHNAGVCTVSVGAAVCQAGTCETGDNLCGMANNHACSTSANCRSGVCNADGKCGVPNDGTCASAAECRSGVCDADGKCGAPNGGSCSNGASCRSGVCGQDQRCGVPNGGTCTVATECRAGVCAADGRCGSPNGDTCTSGTSCRAGSCEAGQCSATCSTTADCGAGLYCGLSSTCVPKLPNDSSCTTTSQCLSDICTAGKCGAATGDPCTTANDCRAGACVSGTCDSTCTADAQCATGMYCSGSSCVATNPNGTPCTANTQCRAGVCDTDGLCGSSTGRPCAGALDCRSGICDASNTCATTCASNSECVAGNFCDPSTHACTPVVPNGGSCGADSQCLSSVCETDNLCGASNGKPCGQPDNCRSAVCSSDGKCGSPNDATCGIAESCRSNVCDTDGKCGGAPGTACTTNAACRDGLCAADGKCGEPNGSPCASATECRSSVCAADGICGDDKGAACVSPETCRTGACSGGTCSLTCQADSECASGTFCSAGFCRAGLPSGQPCTSATQCQAGVCGGDGLCGAPEGGACTVPLNCRTGACAAGTCGPTCSADSECVTAEYCDNGTCAPRSGNNTSCTAAAQCSANACVGGTCGVPNGQPCSSPSQCKSGVCDDQSGSCSANCASNAQCGTGNYCDATSHQCHPSAPNGDPPQRPCTAAAQCASGVCGADGLCGTPDGGACLTGAVCRGGACVAGTCGSGCTADSQCASDAYCSSEGACAPKVATGGTCTRAASCVSGTCAADGHCGTLTGGSCTAAIQCRAGACSNGTCGTSCANDSECLATSFCSSGTCAPKLPAGSQCVTAPQCEAGVCAADGRCGKPQGDGCAAAIQCRSAICSAGVCAASCVADVDCPAHDFCDAASHACLPQGGNNGGGSRTCEGPADCASGVCAPDGLCGYPNGGGSCTPANGPTVCRSGACSPTTGTCVPGGGLGCSTDVDCAPNASYCDAPTLRCTPKLPAGSPLPTDSALHNGGVCTPTVAQAVCVGGQCDPADNRCGMPNSRSCTDASQCRSGVCDTDGTCGLPNGGPCVAANSCRSGQCVAGRCGLPNPSPCLAASECLSGVCTAGVCGVPNGGRCATDEVCQSSQCGTDGYCGGTIGGGCLTGDDCRSGTCVNHACAAACTASSQCAQGLACLAGACSPKTANGGSCATASECSSGTCGADGLCGLPTGDACTSATTCRSNACTDGHCATGCASDANCLATSACVDGTCVPKATGGTSCTRDAECAAGRCALGTCGLPDGQACQLPVACRSNICSQSGTCVATCASDLECAAGTSCSTTHTCVAVVSNGEGCTSNAQCASGVCEADGTCGYADGTGACTSLDAATLCRSGACGSASHTCVPSGGSGCALDADCDTTSYCVAATKTCATKLGGGQPIPEDALHDNGVCTQAIGAAVCASGVCDPSDDLCGIPNDGACTSHAQCRGGSCGPDGRCGLLNGTTCTEAAACRSGTCAADGKCGSTTGACTSGADCRDGLCSPADNHCGLPGGTSCHAASDCRGGVCAADGKCGADTGAACTSGDECRAGACVSQRCSTSCVVDTNCGAGRFCSSGTCTPQAANGAACTRAAQCTAEVCGSDGRCGQANGTSCTSPSQCRVACTSGVCSTSCTADANCAQGTYCQAGACVAGHVNGDACTAGPQCASGLCGADEKCGVTTGGACVRPSDCRSGICDSQGTCASSCASSSDCLAGRYCDGSSTCQPVGANGSTCTSSAQCSAGVCGSNGLCGGAQGEACGAGSMCQSGACDPKDLACGLANGSSGCTEANQASLCRSGVCVNGTCGLEDGAVCASDSECASGSCSAARVCAPVGADPGLVLKGGSGCTSTGEAGLFPAFALVVMGWLARRRRSMKALARATGVGAVLLASVSLGQEQRLVQGFAAQAYDPSYAGDRFFAAPEATTDGHLLPAVKATLNYAYQPVRIVANGQVIPQGVVLGDQLYLHLDGSLALIDRLRLDISLPVALAQTGDPQVSGSTGVQGGRLGDLRVGLRGALFGTAREAFAMGLQADLLLPTGSQEDFAGAGSTRGHLRVIGSGVVNDRLVYSAALGGLLASHREIGLGDVGSSLTYSAAIGVLFAEGQFQVGPELFGATVLASGTSQLEALLGARYRVSGLVLGAGIGAGLTGTAGTAQVRGLLSIAWEPKPAPALEQSVDCSAAAQQAAAELASRDRDGDGIADAVDACSFEVGASSADPAKNGCPMDSDHDGVADAVDACPHELGPEANKGCPLAPDRDGDGVADAEDPCPDVPGTPGAERKGCPPEAAKLAEGRIELQEQVQFPNGKAELLPQSEEVLRGVANVLQAHPELVKVSIDGHTDNRGPPAYNLQLSGDRAASVMEWLVQKGGIARTRLVSKGYGIEKPIASNDDEAGRQRNRRVEVRILEYQKP